MQESKTAAITKLYKEDADIFAWWGTSVECVSAVARVEREGGIGTVMASKILQRLKLLHESWHEIQPVEELREIAKRLLRVHPLRTADALQLAAAFLAAEKTPATLDFVCLDDRLAEAARKEGFAVIGGE
jgi:predicted nucleic acid-binding protein